VTGGYERFTPIPLGEAGVKGEAERKENKFSSSYGSLAEETKIIGFGVFLREALTLTLSQRERELMTD